MINSTVFTFVYSDEQILFPTTLNSGLVPLPCLATNCSAQLQHKFVSFCEENNHSSKNVPQSLNAGGANVPNLQTDMTDELHNLTETRSSNSRTLRAADNVVGVQETSRPLGQETGIQSSENTRRHSILKNAHSVKDCEQRTLYDGSSASNTLVTVFAFESIDKLHCLKFLRYCLQVIRPCKGAEYVIGFPSGIDSAI